MKKTLEQRLSEIESLIKASPDAVSVTTLEERVKLGDAAKLALSRTLSAWDRSTTSVLRRHSLAGRTSVELNSSPYTLTVRYDHSALDSRWPLGTDDADEAERRANLLLAMAQFRLESDPSLEATPATDD